MKKAEGFAEVEADGKTIFVAENNTTMNETCPICNKPHRDANMPYWAFVKGAKGAVCELCMSSIAPDLLEQIEIANGQPQ